MPTFTCPDCGDEFESREARNQHMEDVHGQGDMLERIGDAFTDRKKLGSLLFGVLMVGLPLGGAFFYSTIGPATTAGNGGNPSFSTNPPVGYGLQQLPDVERSSIPRSPYLEQPLPKQTQLYLLVGGTRQIPQPHPAVLLQYSCRNCSDTVQQLRDIASRYNEDSTWVYVAPYYQMNETIALSAFRSLKKMDSVNRTTINRFICNRLPGSQAPLACVDAFDG